MFVPFFFILHVLSRNIFLLSLKNEENERKNNKINQKFTSNHIFFYFTILFKIICSFSVKFCILPIIENLCMSN